MALDGLGPAVAGFFLAVALDLGRSTLRSKRTIAVGVAATVAITTGWLTLLEVIAIAGAVGVALARKPRDGASSLLLPSLAVGAASVPVALVTFGVFARIGIATFGGGTAMVPAIEHEALSRGWLDAQSFADAVALGQITPGPVATTATFVGYRAAGTWGALAATLGVFIGPTALSIACARSLDAFRRNAWLQGFLDGVAPAVVGVVAAAGIGLGRASVHGYVDMAILVLTIAARRAWPAAHPLWPLAAGAAVGVARAMLAGHPVL
jgi:chromate transporter